MAKKRKTKKDRKIKAKKEIMPDDHGPGAIWRDDHAGVCKDCLGSGKIVSPEEKQEKQLSGLRSQWKAPVSPGRPCRACFGRGYVNQIRQEDLQSLITEQLQESAMTRRVTVARRLDYLERLRVDFALEKELYDAGRAFQADFNAGHLSGIKSSTLMRVSGNGLNDFPLAMAYSEARRRVHRAIVKMGGYRSELSSVAWSVFGQQLPLTRLTKYDNGKQFVRLHNLCLEALVKMAAAYNLK